MKTLYGFEKKVDGRRTDRSGTYEVKNLWEIHHEIINLALQGLKNTEIAAMLSVSATTVSNTLNSRLGKAKLKHMRNERDEEAINVDNEVKRLAAKALATYEEIFDNDVASPSLKKATADTVLMDLGGHRSPTKIDARSIHAHLTPEEIAGFVERGKRSSAAAGVPIKIED
jgi:predicted transcriptional regulator